MMEDASAGPVGRSVLPYDVRVTPRWALGEVIKEGKPPTPPSCDELVEDALIASAESPDQWFTSAEQLTAEWLRARGLHVRSVRRREGLPQDTGYVRYSVRRPD